MVLKVFNILNWIYSFIPRHVRETVSSMLSESMVLYYIHTVKDNLWPSEDEIPATELPRTEDDKLRTR